MRGIRAGARRLPREAHAASLTSLLHHVRWLWPAVPAFPLPCGEERDWRQSASRPEYLSCPALCPGRCMEKFKAVRNPAIHRRTAARRAKWSLSSRRRWRRELQMQECQWLEESQRGSDWEPTGSRAVTARLVPVQVLWSLVVRAFHHQHQHRPTAGGPN